MNRQAMIEYLVGHELITPEQGDMLLSEDPAEAMTAFDQAMAGVIKALQEAEPAEKLKDRGQPAKFSEQTHPELSRRLRRVGMDPVALRGLSPTSVEAGVLTAEHQRSRQGG